MDLRVFVEPQMGATYDDQLRVAQLAERLGFDAFFRSDHYLSFSGDGLPGPTDSWATLAALSRETTRIRLGTMVTAATFRLPGPLAITVAQVDAMSAGRVELGIGAGWNEFEHTAYAIPFPSTPERFERLEEQLAIITGLWATPPGEGWSFTGRHYRLSDSPALPKPHQAGGPPVIVGGWGSRVTPRLAATYAAEFNAPFPGSHDLGAAYHRVRLACEAADRDPATLRLSVAVTVCCGTSDDELRRRAAPSGRSLEDLRRNGAAGSPEEVVERLRSYGAIGAERIYCQLPELRDLEHLELLGAAVLPHL